MLKNLIFFFTVPPHVHFWITIFNHQLFLSGRLVRQSTVEGTGGHLWVAIWGFGIDTFLIINIFLLQKYLQLTHKRPLKIDGIFILKSPIRSSGRMLTLVYVFRLGNIIP